MTRNQGEWIGEYRKKNALWISDENPLRPHALLTSGKHSKGFFNSRLVIPDEVLLRDAAADLLEKFVQQGGDIGNVDFVVGPQTGATKLAEYIADQINAYNHGGECFSISPAKHEEDGKKKMVFREHEWPLLFDAKVLICDDVVTTEGSIALTAAAVTRYGGIVRPETLVLVDRSSTIHHSRIISLIERPMPIWDAEDCLLCKKGSEAIPAKDPVNWARLNAEYPEQ